MDVLLHNALTAAQKLYSNATDLAVSMQFEGTLESLATATRDPGQCSRLSKDELVLSELLSYCPIFLSASNTSISLRHQLHAVLYNIAWSNIPLRSHMSSELELCSPVFACMKHSLKQQTGPRSLVDSLRLLQVLTYDQNSIISESWLDELVLFLIKEVCRPAEVEWTPYCLGTLNNLSTRSAVVREKIKRSTSHPQLCRRVVTFLSHDSPFVVICSLSLVSFWDDKLRDTVYSSKNLPQTFQCLFNVLVKGDPFMSRHIAVDLLSRLISDGKSIERKLSLSGFGLALINFAHRDKCLQQVLALLVTLEKAAEQLAKIYDLVLLLCEYSELRVIVCGLVLNSVPVNTSRLTTPLLAMVQTAKLSPKESIIPDNPQKAAKLLRIVLKEVVESSEVIANYLPNECILELIESSVKTTVETGHSYVGHQCNRIVEGLRLAQVVSQDDNLRTDLLEVVTAPLCAHMAEFQMLTNPVSARFCTKSSTYSDLPHWSVAGVLIVLELLELLALLKDHCKSHKDRYWKLLKDDRLVPFLAFAMTSGRESAVRGALKLVVHCSQVQAFQSSWLGQLIAAAGARSHPSVSEPGLPLLVEGSKANDMPNGVEPTAPYDQAVIDELIGKMKAGLNLGDVKVSQLVQVYERKIANLEARDRQLQEFVNTKQTMLQQSERIVSQYRGQKTDTEKEIGQLRSVIRECELKSDKAAADAIESEKEKDQLRQNILTCQKSLMSHQTSFNAIKTDYENQVRELSGQLDNLKRDIANLNSALETSKRENDSEREMHQVLRKHYEDMKRKFEETSKKVFDREEQCKGLEKQLAAKDADIQHCKAVQAKLENSLGDKEQQLSEFEKKMAKLMERNTQLENEKRKLQNEINAKLAELEKLHGDVEEHKKLADMIHKMTGMR